MEAQRASRGESHSQEGGGRDPPQASRSQTSRPQARSLPTLQCSVPPQGLISLATQFYDENGQEGGSPSTPCVPLVQGTDYPLMEPSRGHHGPGPRRETFHKTSEPTRSGMESNRTQDPDAGAGGWIPGSLYPRRGLGSPANPRPPESLAANKIVSTVRKW